jgi:hypothetical protein
LHGVLRLTKAKRDGGLPVPYQFAWMRKGRATVHDLIKFS